MSNLSNIYQKIHKYIFKEKELDFNKNKLMLTSLYILNSFGELDMIYYDILTHLSSKIENDIDKDDIDKISASLYCIIASYQCLEYMPAMLNKPFINKKISSHILFGEGLTYLSSLALISEAYKILLDLPNNIKKLAIIRLFNKDISNFRATSNSIKHFTNISNDHIKEDSYNFKNIIIINIIKTILLLVGKNIDYITLFDTDIKEATKHIINNYQVNYNIYIIEINKLIDKMNLTQLSDT